MKTVKFYIRRLRGPFGYVSVALLSPEGGKIYSMKKMSQIRDYYAVDSTPTYMYDERPMIDSFEFHMEDHMYSAFVITET